MDSNIWPAESLVKILHEILQLLVFFGLGIIAPGLLKAAEGVPSKLDHFLVALGQEPKVMNHLSEEPCRISPTRETEDVDMVTGLVITHDKAVACQEVLLE